MEKVTYSIDQFWDFPDDGQYHEIINGEHIVSKAPSIKHQAISSNLLRQIFSLLPTDFVFHAPTGLFLGEENGIIPDIMVIRENNKTIIEERGVYGTPDWIIEILSPGNPKKDMITLRDVFHKFQVSEYWVVDPELERIYVFLLGDDFTERVIRLEPVKMLKCNVFDIKMDLSKVFILPGQEKEM